MHRGGRSPLSKKYGSSSSSSTITTRTTMSSSFGQWYEQQQQQQQQGSSGDNSNGTSLNLGGLFGGNNSSSTKGGGGEVDVESQQQQNLLPLFGSSSNSSSNSNSNSNSSVGGVGLPESLSWNHVKESLEAQMPQTILGMNYQQRFRMFCALLLLSTLFFLLAFFVGLPVLTLRPQKFAISFTFGSLLFLCSFALLRGPKEHFIGMFQSNRLPFTTIYLLSMFMTLYTTFEISGFLGYIMVMICSLCQIFALIWYLITFLPGGSAGLSLLSRALYTMIKPIVMTCTNVWAACISRLFTHITTTT